MRMPGEFELHECCYVIWPERPDNWRDNALPAQKAFAETVGAIMKFEPVKLICSEKEVGNAEKLLPHGVEIITIETDDAWARDTCPTFVVDEKREIIGIDWIFNAWGGLEGGLYSDWEKDDKLAEKLLVHEKIKRRRSSVVMEGGAFHVDGAGTAMATEECILNKNRNPGLSKRDIEDEMNRNLGVEKIIWIPNGIYNDETDGHIDNIACFARRGVVLLAWEEDEDDPQSEISKKALEVLEHETDADGKKLEIIKINQPRPVIITESESRGVEKKLGTLPRRAGDRLAASYINHYIANGGVVVPVFGGDNEDNDRKAVEILKRVYYPKKVVTVRAREIILGGGNIHCITQQRPRV